MHHEFRSSIDGRTSFVRRNDIFPDDIFFEVAISLKLFIDANNFEFADRQEKLLEREAFS